MHLGPKKQPGLVPFGSLLGLGVVAQAIIGFFFFFAF